MALRTFSLADDRTVAINSKFVIAVNPYGEHGGKQLTQVVCHYGEKVMPFVVVGHFDAVVETLQD
ncbi:hypothetical protein CN233_04475 [Sinorhizobium meliloti]|uniref:hypothetical protein n=1 Tax=Rhizobium meliloti TaxID=382 RepID=UPI000FD7D0B8|nr:hypothetical protein [Sinorhizobium meliloti]RVG37994.1 hypothetical protein CN233_04475 [Sinorhizobium meliloti]